MANIITLTTDWHNSDYYIGAVKALILSRISDAIIIDISHNVDLFSIQQAAFIVKNSYKNFPKDTIHIIGVDSEPAINGNIVVVYNDNQYFICNNNGILGLIFEEKPDKTIVIETGKNYVGATFPELSVFSEIACYIAEKGNISELGVLSEDVLRFPELMPQIDTDEITGTVIYIDSYFNAITNITKKIFQEYVDTNKYEIFLNSNYNKTNRIYSGYKDVNNGEIVCLFNSLDLLEIAIRNGKASLLLNLDRNSIIKIKYNI